MTEKSKANQKLRDEMKRKVEKIRKVKIGEYKPDSDHKNTWGNKKDAPVISPNMLIN